MDGLALLCNLHADGPVSLRRLRESGVRTLDALLKFPEDSLAAILSSSRAHTRRLVNEAAQLDARLCEMRLDRPPFAAGVIERSSPSVQAYDLQPPVESPPPLEFGPAPNPPPEVEPDVEGCGHELDAPAATLDREVGRGGVEDAVSPVAPASSAGPRIEGSLLRKYEIAGLDARTCEALVREGVRTYRSLVDLASLSLSRRTGIPFTRLLDLRFRARSLLCSRLRLDESGRAPARPGRQAAAHRLPLRGSKPEDGENNGASEPTVELTPLAPPSRSGASPPSPHGEYRPSRVFAGTQLVAAHPPTRPRPDPDEAFELARDCAREDPGVAGPFV